MTHSIQDHIGCSQRENQGVIDKVGSEMAPSKNGKGKGKSSQGGGTRLEDVMEEARDGRFALRDG